MMKWKVIFYEVVNLQSSVNSLDEDDSIENSDSAGDEETAGNFDTTCVRESILTYKIVQECWKRLYTAEISLRLHDAVKRHVFKHLSGEDGTLAWEEMTEDYDALIF